MEKDTTAEKPEALSVEEIFSKLEEMALKLEDGGIPLEETFRIYAEGMDLLKQADAKIDGVEKQMQILLADTKDGDDEGEARRSSGKAGIRPFQRKGKDPDHGGTRLRRRAEGRQTGNHGP